MIHRLFIESLILVQLINLAHAEALPPVNKDQARHLQQQVSSANQFVLGMAGFAGRISESETAMRRLAASREAEDYLDQILSNASTTIEGKLYAICGLKLIRSKRYDAASNSIKAQSIHFSTFYGDILKKENIDIALNNINSSKCKEL